MTVASGAKSKPALDESSFQQLLAAAYVVQQHNDGSRAKDPAYSTSIVLAEIADIQSLVRAGGFDLSDAARLTVERLQKITQADSATIYLLSNGALDCVAEAGPAGNDVARFFIADSIVANQKLQSGELVQSDDVQRDPLLHGASPQRGMAGSLMAAPIQVLDEFAGVIELRSARVHAFRESDARAARLMSGLMGSVLERNTRRQRQETLVSPRSAPEAAASSVNTLEQQGFDEPQPVVGQLAENAIQFPEAEPGGSLADSVDRDTSEPWHIDEFSSAQAAAGTTANDLPHECRVCGRPFGASEAFCGQCSMPRVAGPPSEDLQSKWASLWYLQKAQENRPKQPTPEPLNLRPSAQIASPPAASVPAEPAIRTWHVAEPTAEKIEHAPIEPTGIKPVAHDESLFFFDSTKQNGTPTSRTSDFAVQSTAFAETARADQDLLQSTWQAVWARTGRRHATLALTVMGFLLVFLMIAVWPSSKNSQLTWFQSMLVELGLAEVPAHAPAFAGNPDARVWVDVHTALYYCQGSDLYGKTPGGHFATQHEAQQDEFGPASRVTCP